MSFELILPFFRPIERLLSSETISEIMVNPDGLVWVEEEGNLALLPEVRFEPGALDAALEVVASRFGRKLDADSPILNLRLPDGSRLAAIIPPVVSPRPLLTIRKFTARRFRMEQLVERETLSRDLAQKLQSAVERGDNILISGGTNCGKTTLLNILAGSIPEGERILVIEDTSELAIAKPHVVATEAQINTYKTPITFDDLLKAILRHRPDRIIVGEVRGPEARTLLDALNTGHRGMLATVHASSARGALERIAHLAARGNAHSAPSEIQAEVASGIDCVVHLGRRSGRRRVEQVLDMRAEEKA
jgi:pilus assembly protein CpaF